MGAIEADASPTHTTKKRTREPDAAKTPQQEMTDPRFVAAETDPRFSRVPKRSKKAAIDNRFKRKLKENPAFRKSDTPVDRFGKPKRDQPLDETLRNALADDDDSDSDSEDDHYIGDSRPVPSHLAAESDSDDSEVAEFLEEEEAEPPEHIPRGKATRRLAVIGLDWTTTRAVDIFACLDSFCPPGKSVQAVEVHPSKFGLERLAAEAKFGPQVMAKADLKVVEDAAKQRKTSDPSGTREEANDQDEYNSDTESSSEEEDDDIEERRWKEQSALRKYEEERLKYYYAVAEFEDVKTADAVYEQCDGVEYAQSGRAFDLRFIPDDMKIETTRRDRADSVPDGYLPPNVAPSSLNSSTVKLSWDADDPDRVVLKKKAVGKQQLDEENLKAYLASSSENDDEKESATEIEKKRNLLLGSADDAVDNEEDMGMEITFDPGMLEKAEEIVKRKKVKEERQEETPWESRLRRLQERKAEKRKLRKEAIEAFKLNGNVPDKNEVAADDENDMGADTSGFEDPFFSSEKTIHDEVRNKRIRKDAKRKGSIVDEDELTPAKDAEEARKRAELELLVMDGVGKKGTKSGSLREMLAAADSDDDDDHRKSRGGRRGAGRRRARRDNKEKGNEAEPSTMDMKDPRFQGLFESHLYAIDPTHPKYRENETTQKILKEKIRRTKRRSGTKDDHNGMNGAPIEASQNDEVGAEKKNSANSELRQLAARLKARAKVSKRQTRRP